MFDKSDPNLITVSKVGTLTPAGPGWFFGGPPYEKPILFFCVVTIYDPRTKKEKDCIVGVCVENLKELETGNPWNVNWQDGIYYQVPDTESPFNPIDAPRW